MPPGPPAVGAKMAGERVHEHLADKGGNANAKREADKPVAGCVEFTGSDPASDGMQRNVIESLAEVELHKEWFRWEGVHKENLGKGW